VPLFFSACASSRPLMSLGANCVVMLRGHIQGSPNRIVSQPTRCTKNTWTQRVCCRSCIWFVSETSVLLLSWCVFTVANVQEVPFMFASARVWQT
jgi:hypothetical protein